MKTLDKIFKEGLTNFTMIDLLVVGMVNLVLLIFLLSIPIFSKHFFLIIATLVGFNWWWQKFFKKAKE